jgi:DNA-binding transcriptional LysR family regulator
VNLRSLDLNLLVIFDALIGERSVSRAAQRLGLTQSAVSHALRRLRELFGDELLIRRAGAMELTWRAEQLSVALRSALGQIEALVSEDVAFDPMTSTRVFRLRVSDYVSSFLLGRLCGVLRAEAPGVRLHVGHFGEAGHEVIGDEIHVRLASEMAGFAKYHRTRVFEDAFVVVMGRHHLAAGEPMTLDLYVKLVHLKVAASAIGSNRIDEALARRGLVRDVAMRVPSWLDVRPIVEATDLVAALPRRWTQTPAFAATCVTAPLPLDDVELAIDAVWDARHDDDPGLAWLRGTIARVMQEDGAGRRKALRG